MRYEIHSHRFGRKIADEGEFSEDWNEILSVLNSITDLELNMSSNIAEFNTFSLNFYYNKFNLILEID